MLPLAIERGFYKLTLRAQHVLYHLAPREQWKYNAIPLQACDGTWLFS